MLKCPNKVCILLEQNKNIEEGISRMGEKVKCLLCGKEFENSITGSHLSRIHQTNLKDYMKEFPSAKVSTDEFEQKMKNVYATRNLKVKKIDEPKPEVVEKVPVKEVKKTITYHGDIHPDKARIVSYLSTHFGIGLVKNNYYVEPKGLDSEIPFSLVTDVSIPVIKVDLEFLDVIWHNHDRPKEVRDHMLKQFGWKIIDIRGVPSNSELKQILEEHGLKS
jgi:hypothetical protein